MKLFVNLVIPLKFLALHFLIGVNSQPFLNSLAVLFRARPPWPTTFPASGQFQLFPPPMPTRLAGPTQQGYFVAHSVRETKHLPPNIQHLISAMPSGQKVRQIPVPTIPLTIPSSSPVLISPLSHLSPLKSSEAQNPQQATNFIHIPQPLVTSPSSVEGKVQFPSDTSTSGSSGGQWLYSNNNNEIQDTFQNNPKSKLPDDFRPSPQLSTYYETTIINNVEKIPDVIHPTFESGFRPMVMTNFETAYSAAMKEKRKKDMTSYNSYASNQYAVPQQIKYKGLTKNRITLSSTERPLRRAKPTKRQDRKITSQSSIVSTIASFNDDEEEEEKPMKLRHVSPSSSELVEDWVSPKPKRNEKKAPVYTHNKRNLKPSAKCDKFHRFGFCPVTSHYPLSQVEKIAARCSALVAHLVSPLPKTEARYETVVGRNSTVRGRAGTSTRGWSWKSYRGRPVCETEEIKIVPGWAKNEDGEWLVILQTESLKQEAQISLCSPPGADCQGSSCQDRKDEFLETKCVQRFTAQRLAVLDPENEERCPVVRSVYLPSACVCLSLEPSATQNEEFDEFTENDVAESKQQRQYAILPKPLNLAEKLNLTVKTTTTRSEGLTDASTDAETIETTTLIEPRSNNYKISAKMEVSEDGNTFYVTSQPYIPPSS